MDALHHHGDLGRAPLDFIERSVFGGHGLIVEMGISVEEVEEMEEKRRLEVSRIVSRIEMDH